MGDGRREAFVAADTGWFDKDPERYLDSDRFVEFSRISGVDLRRLCEEDDATVAQAQERLIRQSIILNEIQKDHGGYAFPLFVYTQCPGLCEPVPEHNVEADRAILRLDMTDSLRRRHIGLSFSLLPRAISAVHAALNRPLCIHNLGSGIGLDLLRAATALPRMLARVVNFDTNSEAIALGRRIAAHLRRNGSLGSVPVDYHAASLTGNHGRCDVAVMIGVICGLPDRMAQVLLRRVRRRITPGGALVVSSSNSLMRSEDPLASFLIQHIGSRDDPRAGWGLNFRTEEGLRALLERTGYADIQIFDDANYPGRQDAEARLPDRVDTLPGKAKGVPVLSPITLPETSVLARRRGYNWIALARVE